MIKYVIQILLIFIVIIIMNLIYQIYFTYQYHDGNPVLFFPDIRYSLTAFIVFTFIIGVVFEKSAMHSKWSSALVFGLLITVLFYSSATFIEHKYTYLYDHYYQRTPYENLTHLKEYRNELDNRLTLGKALKEEGIKIKNIKGGYTDKGHQVNSPKDYRKKVYYVNDDLYIIFDWDKEEITAQENQREILQLLYEKFDQINKEMHSNALYSHFGIRLIDEDNNVIKNFTIVPTNKNTFEFLDD